jgi:hypothetical protein
MPLVPPSTRFEKHWNVTCMLMKHEKICGGRLPTKHHCDMISEGDH